MAFQSHDEFLSALSALIGRWCDERRLRLLADLLPGYVGLNGLNDGWADLHESLKVVQGRGLEAIGEPD